MLIGIDASRITRAHLTGTENYTLQVLRALLAIDTRDAYRLYTSAPLPTSLLAPRAPCETRYIKMPRLWTHLGLSLQMLAAPPDVLFVPTHVLPLVTPKSSVPVIYDVGHRYFPTAYQPAQWLYLEWSVRRQVRIAPRVITISVAAKRDLVRLYGADPTRVTVAYPAVDAFFHRASPDAIRRVCARHGLTSPYVLHVGTIKPRKNLVRLVQAFGKARLPADTLLALVGASEPAELRRVRQAAVGAGLNDRVRFLSYVPNLDLPALYSGSSCTAIVSLFEGFGIPALEALACGSSLLVSNRGSLPEVVGDSALIVDPLDTAAVALGLKTLVEEAEHNGLPAWAETGPRRADAFSWARAAEVTRGVLRQVGAASL